MKKFLTLMILLSTSANAFYISCKGQNDVEILISAATRDVIQTKTGAIVDEAYIDFTMGNSGKYVSGDGSAKIEDGLTTFKSDFLNFKFRPYQPVDGNQNTLSINHEIVFEDIDLSCSSKM